MYSKHGYKFINNDRQIIDFIHKKAFGSYHFIGLDASFDSTILQPSNFFGRLRRSAMDEFEGILEANKFTHNHTIVFAHYPTSIIHMDATSSGLKLYDLTKKYKILGNFFAQKSLIQ